MQHDAAADTAAPTATLDAADVTTAAAPDPYQFTVTYADNVAIAAATLAGAVVAGRPARPVAAAITASVVSTMPVGSTDPSGNARAFVVTYQFTPPDGSWSPERRRHVHA